MSALSAAPAAPNLLGADSRVPMPPGPFPHPSLPAPSKSEWTGFWKKDEVIKVQPWHNWTSKSHVPTPSPKTIKQNEPLYLMPSADKQSYGSGTQHSGKGKDVQMLTSNENSITKRSKRGVAESPASSVKHVQQKARQDSKPEAGPLQAIVVIPAGDRKIKGATL